MKDLFSSYVKAQAELGAAAKDSTNPHFRSKYADLASVVAAIKPIIVKHGLGYIQKFGDSEGGVSIETIIVHECGDQYPCGPLFVPATKQDAQGYGSAITYARRYSLQTAFGIPSDDDDGNAASKPVIKHSPVAATMQQESIKVDEGRLVDVVNAFKTFLEEAAQGKDNDFAIFELAESLDQEMKIAVSPKLSSGQRAAIKKICDAQRKAA